jgi:nucleotide-binding universal stress UspA family protein
MEKLFNHILVPFHLWEDADTAVQKAVELANQWQAHLHLLQFIQRGSPAVGGENEKPRTAMWQRYQPRLDPALSLTIGSHEGPAEEGIIAYQRNSNIDLVLLSRHAPSFLRRSNASFPLNMNRLMKRLTCPVLNIGPKLSIPPIRNIVLPVGKLFPMRKLLFATYLAKRSHSTIHLVSGGGYRDGHSTTPIGMGMEGLHRSYRLLRENTDLPVECWTLQEENPAAAAWAYAKRIKADLILIQPGRESHLPGLFSALRSRLLFDVSGIPVMTVP